MTARGYVLRTNAALRELERAEVAEPLGLVPALAWLLGLTALIAVGRIYALSVNETDLFFDEAQYWAWAKEPAFGYYSKPPLIAWVIAATTEACGNTPFCVRLWSPITYAGTAIAVFAAARLLYDNRVALWSALAFLLLPGVSLSSGIASTDVLLLACWAVALATFIAFVRRPSWSLAILLGVAIGVGLNAKYAMAYFVLCTLVYAVASARGRTAVLSIRFASAIAIAAALIAPNLFWNAETGFATFSHTADNAKWTGELGNPLKALEFFGSQFGVFGPIMFGALLVICWRAWREGLPDGDGLLLAFAVPVVLIVTVQAFISRAHPNWAAVSYVAATILVTATMFRDRARIARWASAGLHAVVAAGLAVSAAQATSLSVAGLPNPYARTLGWEALANDIRSRVEAHVREAGPVEALIADRRAL
ncbi:MAG: glycosyltransferase family 39 protein, partial [Pseudomonadota bacterium]